MTCLVCSALSLTEPAFAASTYAAPNETGPEERLLWADEPLSLLDESGHPRGGSKWSPFVYPIGNGRLGATIFGGPAEERRQEQVSDPSRLMADRNYASPVNIDLDLEARCRVLPEGGRLKIDGNAMVFENCDALTLILSADTNYVNEIKNKGLSLKIPPPDGARPGKLLRRIV